VRATVPSAPASHAAPPPGNRTPWTLAVESAQIAIGLVWIAEGADAGLPIE